MFLVSISVADFIFFTFPKGCNLDPIWNTGKVLWNTQDSPCVFLRMRSLASVPTLSIPKPSAHPDVRPLSMLTLLPFIVKFLNLAVWVV